MADNYYSKALGDLSNRDVSKITVATSSQTSSIELRITAGTITRRQAYLFCELMADIFSSGSNQNDGAPVPVGQFGG